MSCSFFIIRKGGSDGNSREKTGNIKISLQVQTGNDAAACRDVWRFRQNHRDILEVEATFHVPLDVRCGKYDGGVFVIGDYSFDRAYMHEEELALLSKVQELVKDQLSEKENALLSQIIKIYTKAA